MMRLLALGFLVSVVTWPLAFAGDSSPARGLRRTVGGFLVTGVTYALLTALFLPGSA
jgi:hypothetical protein